MGWGNGAAGQILATQDNDLNLAPEFTYNKKNWFHKLALWSLHTCGTHTLYSKCAGLILFFCFFVCLFLVWFFKVRFLCVAPAILEPGSVEQAGLELRDHLCKVECSRGEQQGPCAKMTLK